MSSIWGDNLKVSLFGESHSEGIGVVIDGLPAGEKIDMDELLGFMARRSSTGGKTDTPRMEKDYPIIMSGVVNGTTCGTPVCAVIKNTNTRSGDYEQLREIARPGHADYTGYMRYKGFNDIRGGGHFSGRLTAPLVFAGGIAKQILSRKGIEIGAHIFSVADVYDEHFDLANTNAEQLKEVSKKYFPTINEEYGKQMISAIENASTEGDSVGGSIECAAVGIDAGVGNPFFDSVESKIASMMFSIPAVKGIEFGAGFGVATMKGSQCNDSFYIHSGKVLTKTNNNGGILGGITNGMPVMFRVAIKPTSSIGIEQNSVNFVKKEDAKLKVNGRHDPCILRRAVPCIESGMALSILDLIL